MRRKQAGKSAEIPQQPTRMHLAHEDCVIVRAVYSTVHQSTLDKFTYSFINSLCKDLQAVIHRLDRLPEVSFQKMVYIIHCLSEARNELRLARFLFDVEEISPIYRLMMRNRAVMRGKQILSNTLQVWP
jgi:hypothetical protein